jgi:hypothetical protein
MWSEYMSIIYEQWMALFSMELFFAGTAYTRRWVV